MTSDAIRIRKFVWKTFCIYCEISKFSTHQLLLNSGSIFLVFRTAVSSFCFKSNLSISIHLLITYTQHSKYFIHCHSVFSYSRDNKDQLKRLKSLSFDCTRHFSALAYSKPPQTGDPDVIREYWIFDPGGLILKNYRVTWHLITPVIF